MCLYKGGYNSEFIFLASTKFIVIQCLDNITIHIHVLFHITRRAPHDNFVVKMYSFSKSQLSCSHPSAILEKKLNTSALGIHTFI